MGCLIAFIAAPLNDALTHTHIREESHGYLRSVYLLLSQPRGVFDRLLNVFTFQIRKSLEYFIEAGTEMRFDATSNLCH